MKSSRAFVDGIEGPIARLLIHEDVLEVPISLLPQGVREGVWVEIAVGIVPAPPDDSEERRRRLAADDPGGDVEL